ncbi:hypothetical protein [Amycolatopsis circi]|uniref:hypothetical protein n=1 Tax=Amycolatopsis circi TaxID=871959 RepID=UPI000E282137|nr:hypothetical protein [Amycolatopsis circi]
MAGSAKAVVLREVAVAVLMARLFAVAVWRAGLRARIAWLLVVRWRVAVRVLAVRSAVPTVQAWVAARSWAMVMRPMGLWRRTARLLAATRSFKSRTMTVRR